MVESQEYDGWEDHLQGNEKQKLNDMATVDVRFDMVTLDVGGTYRSDNETPMTVKKPRKVRGKTRE